MANEALGAVQVAMLLFVIHQRFRINKCSNIDNKTVFPRQSRTELWGPFINLTLAKVITIEVTKDSQKILRLKALPRSNEPLRLVSVGPVTRSTETSPEPKWTTVFKRVSTQKNYDPEKESQILTYNVAAASLTTLLLGSKWKRQLITHEDGELTTHDVKIPTDTQQVLWRHETDEGYHFSDLRADNSIPYIFVDTPHEPFDGLMIRCTEVIRFYFSASSLLSNFIFDFQKGGSENRYLFNSRKTHFVEKDGNWIFQFKPSSFILKRKSWIQKDQFVFIAQQLSYLPAQKALARISQSARMLSNAGLPIWPETTIPLEGNTTWRVVGTLRDVYISTKDNKTQQFCIMAAASILKCGAKVIYHKPRILLPPTQKRPPSVYDPERLATASGIKNNPDFTSDEVPGAFVDLVVHPMQDIAESRPGIVSEPAEIAQDINVPPAESVIEMAPVKDEVETVSGLSGTGGSDDVGSFSVIPSGADQINTGEINQPPEIIEKDRSELPLLFSKFIHEMPTNNDTPMKDVPDEFVPIIQGGQIMAKRFAQDWKLMVLDKTPLNSATQSIQLWDLPESWGPKVRCPNSPTQRRRALVISIFSRDVYSYILDIELTQKSQFAPYLILTNRTEAGANSVRITKDVIANAIHWRLFHTSGNAWPNRETHNGPFWGKGLRHASGDDAGKQMFNRIRNQLLGFQKAPKIHLG
ncbi:MAG: hypothetical protein OQK24_11760 [Magnetovibrio sp.]|nr:hypothetical protein [Magnetovibrio sp.]